MLITLRVQRVKVSVGKSDFFRNSSIMGAVSTILCLFRRVVIRNKVVKKALTGYNGGCKLGTDIAASFLSKDTGFFVIPP